MNTRSRSFLLIFIILAWSLLVSQTAAQDKKSLDPKSLPKVLAEGAASLEKDIAAGKAEAEAVQQQVKEADKALQNLRGQIATLKAAQAAGELQLKQAQEALEGFSQREGQANAQIGEFQGAREQLAKQMSTRVTALDALKQEVERLKAAKHPLWKSEEVRKSWERLQQLGKQYKTGASQTLERFDEVLWVLEQESQALKEVIEELKTHVEVVRKEELLKRQTAKTLWETVKQTWKFLWEMPARITQTLTDPLLSEKVAATLKTKWAPLLGLLALFLIMAKTALQIRRLALPKLALWEAEVTELGGKVVFKAGEFILTHLFSLSFVTWLALTEWVLGWWDNQVARILLLGIFVGVGLRLGLKLIQAVFAGQDRGGILPLDEVTARFYRRHFKLLLIYLLVVGWFALTLFQRLGLEPESQLILEEIFGVGLMVWVFFLLRSRHFDSLRTELPGPEWFRKRGFFLTVRVLMVGILGAIIITSLLGFQNLSAYITQAASILGWLLVLLWVTWQVARTILDQAIQPPKGAAPRKLRWQEEVLREKYFAILKVVVFFLVIAAFLLMLKAWGVDTTFLVWLSQGLNWGTKLGPLNLTVLNLGLAALVLYLGRWFSRFIRVFLEVRSYHRAHWDDSLLYTISNTFHYVIMAIAVLMALGFLGVSFGDLAIVAGGLGVGIGFGLQNVVNNFISGLILLFERPIKVGDLLIIDGKWGRVKEIRVRSTIFENSDRSVLIIPNSEMLSSKIHNWTHYGAGVNRLTLKVGVSYGSDVRQVTKVLDEVCRANPRVVPEPPPKSSSRPTATVP